MTEAEKYLIERRNQLVKDKLRLERENERLRDIVEMMVDMPVDCHNCERIVTSIDDWINHDCDGRAKTVLEGE